VAAEVTKRRMGVANARIQDEDDDENEDEVRRLSAIREAL